MKLVIAGLLSAALVLLTDKPPTQNLNNSVASVETQTVQAKANETKTDISQEPSPQPPKATVSAQAKVEVPAPSHPKGCENYRSLVSQYNWNVNVALNVMRAESGCNPSAIGDGHLTYYQNGIKYGMSCGMFQVRILPGRPSCNEMQNPELNIAKAYQLYAAGGWKHWTVCNKGIVSCY